MLDYPMAVRDQDLRYRPASARGGSVRFQVGDRSVVVRRRRGTVFERRRPTRGTGERGSRRRHATATAT